MQSTKDTITLFPEVGSRPTTTIPIWQPCVFLQGCFFVRQIICDMNLHKITTRFAFCHEITKNHEENLISSKSEQVFT